MTTYDEILDELRTALLVEDIDSIRNRQGEWVDGWVPIYNNHIIAEWQEMPGEYDDRGGQELGTDGTIGIVGLMTLDLYLYYSDLLERALQELETELEEKEGQE